MARLIRITYLSTRKYPKCQHRGMNLLAIETLDDFDCAPSMLWKLCHNFPSTKSSLDRDYTRFIYENNCRSNRSNFTLLLSVSLLVNEANQDRESHAMEAWLSGNIYDSRSWQKFVKIFLQQILLPFHFNCLINPVIDEILF